jgi:hypothetical protein
VIQDGLDGTWSEQIKKALDAFRQGHLVERPPFFYAASLKYGLWNPTRLLAEEAMAADEELGEELVDLDPTQGPPYGLITSQTCDVAEERPDPLQPWIQVAPVYCCDPKSKLLDRDFVTRLEPPDLAEATWFADLRIEVPLEKSMMVGRTPIEAFSNEADYEELGNVLGQRRGRPALHSVFHEVLNVTMGDMKTKNKTMRKTARRVRETIYKLKLGIEDGTRLKPVAARLYIVTRGAPTTETKDWFAEWWNRAREIASKAGLELLPNTWLDAENLEIDLESYDRLLDIRNPLLS